MLADVPDFSVESVFLRIFRQMKKSSRKIKEVMQMNIFETVKAAVTVRQAAEHFGPPPPRLLCLHFGKVPN